MSISLQNPVVGPMMSRFSMQYGWLLYANPDINGPGRAMVLHGPAAQFEISRDASMYGTTIEARFMLPGAELLTGRPMDVMMWEALQKYPGDGRELPPQVRAMTELARRHPDEYRDLCDRYGLPPLLVVRDAWVGG